ncbi:DUF1036 domain-containing protein [Bradyrhizobium sp. 76]|uniref:DUF1036 domain-containing protein n=1 Tax=Bradyrhizobium sp. 76 TaxID=2782680 RepID=UPI001FFACCFA|nr:DUF1036 domain-containing protein [Bradyrhizobium sp. 76]MCK1409537.1 DUF1036 domain-containing protein [Bradyrhizobium sp. 76]
MTNGSAGFAKLIWLAAVAAASAIGSAADAQQLEKFVVDGLALGAKVRTESSVYGQYTCEDSSQFRDFRSCRRVKSEVRGGRNITTTTTILHAADGSVAYVNQSIDPAFFTREELESEISRLSSRYGEKPHRQELPNRTATIATWGTIELASLPDADMAILRRDERVLKGILVDYIGDYTRSAQAGLPVFSIQGGAGYAWVGSHDGQGRGRLRVFAIDAARLASARQLPKPPAPPNVVAAQSSVHMKRQQGAAQQAELEQRLQECGESCPDKPDLDKTRLETLEAIERASRETEDSESFTSALGNEEALRAYLSACETNKCKFAGDALAELDGTRRKKESKLQAQIEDGQYRTARGDFKALKQYVASCSVCEFARDALDEINQRVAEANGKVFDLEICNSDYADVKVAVAGRRDVFSQMMTTEGWYSVGSGKCRIITKLVRGEFYLRAKSARAEWMGNEKRSFCTESKPFTRVNVSDDECIGDEQSQTFGRHSNLGDNRETYTWRLDAKPWTFVALAYSPTAAVWGWSAQQPSVEEAQKIALEYCSQHASDCEVARWVRDDDCLVLFGGSKSLGWATGSNAQSEAYQNCKDADGVRCRLLKSSCN